MAKQLVEHYDCIVVGSGPSGQKAAIQASKFGKKVAIIEAWALGGSSTNTATIPSKTLREAILDLTNFQNRSFYAQEETMPKKEDISISDLTHRVGWVTEHLRDTISRQLLKNHIEIIYGFGKFQDPHHMSIYDQHGKLLRSLHADTFFLSPGSKPRTPEGVKFDGQKILTSTQLLKLDHIPDSLAVVGAGVIGAEYASMFSILGTRVVMLDKRSRPLSFLDREISAHLQIALEENNLHFLGNCEYQSIRVENNEVVITLTKGDEIRAEAALIAAGRIANVENLDIDKAGLALNQSGHIEVNESYQTSVPHIYAMGDVKGGPSLSSTGYIEGRIAAKNACGQPVKKSMKVFPFGIYTIPEISYIGKTEDELLKEGVPYEIGRAYFYEVARSVITGSNSGLCKIIFHKENLQVLGAHIIGRGATEVIHIAQVAISFNATIEYFVEEVFNFPTFAEMYKIAALNGMNKIKSRG